MCWHKYEKLWTDGGVVFKHSIVPAKQYKRCTKCNKVKYRTV